MKFAIALCALTTFSACDNYIIENEQAVNTAWGNLQSQYQRRADLIPNLVETVKGAAAHEKDTLEAVIAARNAATTIKLDAGDLEDPNKVAQFQKAQGSLAGALRQVFALQEQYPEIRANQNFRDLQVQIEGTENRIQRAREQYNEAVQVYNAAILKWPGRWLAGGRKPKQAFAAEAGAETAPKVKF
jgi:LemA protein